MGLGRTMWRRVAGGYQQRYCSADIAEGERTGREFRNASYKVVFYAHQHNDYHKNLTLDGTCISKKHPDINRKSGRERVGCWIA